MGVSLMVSAERGSSQRCGCRDAAHWGGCTANPPGAEAVPGAPLGTAVGLPLSGLLPTAEVQISTRGVEEMHLVSTFVTKESKKWV